MQFRCLRKIEHLLEEILKQGKKIMSSQAELAEQLRGVSTLLNEVAVEEDALQQNVADLTAALANAPVTPEVQAAADALAAQAKVLADKVPAVQVPPAEPTA